MPPALRARFSLMLATLSAAATAGCEPKATASPDDAAGSIASDSTAAAEGSDKAEHACGDHAEGACAGKSPEAPAGTQPTTRTITVAPGEFAEVNFALSEGAEVSARYGTGGANTKWNVHSHGADHEVIVHQKGNDAEGELRFVAPSSGVFSFLWVNENDAPFEIEVEVRVGDGAAIHSWAPEAAPAAAGG